MWCSAASKREEAPPWSYPSSKIMLPKNFYTITGDSDASNWVLQFLHPFTTVRFYLTAAHTHAHTHNRSLRIFIGLAQFDRSLNLPASLILDKRTRKNTSAKECVRQCIDLDRWLRGQKQGKQLCMLNEGIKNWQPSNNKKIIKMLY